MINLPKKKKSNDDEPLYSGPADSTLADRIDEAHAILAYNQQLVEFADSKAGNLILINSLFIAAAQAMPASGILKAFQAGFIFCSAIAVLISLSVIMSRNSSGLMSLDDNLPKKKKTKKRPPDFVFFIDILSRKDAEKYIEDYESSSESVRYRGILARAYVVAEIAARKFRTFAPAQTITALSAGLWLVANLISVFVAK